MLENLKWFGQSSFLLADGRRVYLDPWQLKEGLEPADLIFITHAHGDHLSPDDVRKLQKDTTTIVGPPDCLEKLTGNKVTVKPGDSLEIEGIKVEVVRAYNIGKPYHPMENNWVGYVLEVDGQRLYHAGDTDRIPEMRNIRTDVALLPIGGTYTMDAAEAAQAASDINPRVAVPMHYGKVVGTAEDAQRFKELAKVEVHIMQQE